MEPVFWGSELEPLEGEEQHDGKVLDCLAVWQTELITSSGPLADEPHLSGEYQRFLWEVTLFPPHTPPSCCISETFYRSLISHPYLCAHTLLAAMREHTYFSDTWSDPAYNLKCSSNVCLDVQLIVISDDFIINCILFTNRPLCCFPGMCTFLLPRGGFWWLFDILSLPLFYSLSCGVYAITCMSLPREIHIWSRIETQGLW